MSLQNGRCWIFLFLIFSTLIVFAEEQSFVLFTQPKTGTHLLRQLLEDLTEKEGCWSGSTEIGPHKYASKLKYNSLLNKGGYLATHWFCMPTEKDVVEEVLTKLYEEDQFLYAHAPYTEEMEKLLIERDTVVFFLLRDPRDYAVSMAYHCLKGDGFIREEVLQNMSFDDILTLVIRGNDWHNSSKYILENFLGWKSSPITCSIDFAKLQGEKGGAYTEEEQLQELRKLAEELNLSYSDVRLLESFKRVYGKGPTFRKAKVGTWREHFNEKHKREFKKYLGDLLIELGYEDSNDW